MCDHVTDRLLAWMQGQDGLVPGGAPGRAPHPLATPTPWTGRTFWYASSCRPSSDAMEPQIFARMSSPYSKAWRAVLPCEICRCTACTAHVSALAAGVRPHECRSVVHHMHACMRQ